VPQFERKSAIDFQKIVNQFVHVHPPARIPDSPTTLAKDGENQAY
jgi:hypothetical protein